MVHIRKDDAVNPTQANPACVVAPLRHIEGERRTYEGFLQPFASHSHSHYAIGFVRRGMRTLECNGEAHALVPGDVAVFNPGDVHGCVQSGEGPFAYDSFALPERAFGSTKLAGPVLRNHDARDCARDLLVRGVSPADVAAATGFSDQAHLTRAFKQRIGSTPAAYRAMVTGGDVQ